MSRAFGTNRPHASIWQGSNIAQSQKHDMDVEELAGIDIFTPLPPSYDACGPPPPSYNTCTPTPPRLVLCSNPRTRNLVTASGIYPRSPADSCASTGSTLFESAGSEEGGAGWSWKECVSFLVLVLVLAITSVVAALVSKKHDGPAPGLDA
ncbi:hypothetical protein EJ03DRAFT_377247 [Teratosphaeria nubilosa]|uniref:Uncharacterized protein n=1 Tax=Teratosphaeria nubilosa TaxID=161662 RepID=A0A6G1L0K1_9PEZI|nr:hypothetical protein EJ03DRAFT_377247 [Teratosphaeria nubilosa]